MSNSDFQHTPPVIRVFISSTFADMDHERSYFNEVLSPKISRICAERGVSFFSVDLRWGITTEEQVNGKVLPICLNEIDKCRPYFIGILGNRYGSILETVPAQISQTIPWLAGKEGHSITELEMLYAVLDHSREQMESNSAFYIRSDRLSHELYGNLQPEKTEALTSEIGADAELDAMSTTIVPITTVAAALAKADPIVPISATTPTPDATAATTVAMAATTAMATTNILPNISQKLASTSTGYIDESVPIIAL